MIFNLILIGWVVAIVYTAILSDKKNLSTPLWTVLSVFFGPIILLTVVLIPERSLPKQQSTETGDAIEVTQINQDLRNAKNFLKKLEQRILKLETRGAPSLKSKKLAPEVKRKKETESKVVPVVKQKVNLELKVGQYWLSRVGSFLLVLGVAFLITYSFKFFNAYAKVALGYLMGMGLFFFGLKLEKKEKLKYYARAIIGGAWGLLYFTTYAMYHFDASRILYSQLADFVLLAAVVVGIIIHSLKYKSQTLTAIALFIGYFTATLSDLTFFTFASCLLLAIAAGYLICKMGMARLIYYGIFLTYITHYFWTTRNIADSLIVTRNFTVNQVIFWLNSIFLFTYWLVFTVTAYYPKANKDKKQSSCLPLANLYNFLFFFFLQLGWVSKIYPDSKFYFILGMGGVYLILLAITYCFKNEEFKMLNWLVSLSLITAALPLKLSPEHTSLVWLFEIPIVVYAGLLFKKRYLRGFGIILSILLYFKFLFVTFGLGTKISLFDLQILWRDIILVISFISMGICYGIYKASKIVDDRAKRSLVVNIYSLLSANYFVMFAWLITPLKWLTVVLFLEALIFFVLGLILSDSWIRFYGLAILSMAWFRILFIDDLFWGVLKWPLILLQVGISYLIYSFSKIKKTLTKFLGHEKGLLSLVVVCTTIVLTILVFKETPGRWISLFLALEGIVLFTTGFLAKDKKFRIAGFLIFLALLTRVVFVDIQALETIYKIISFIAIGVIFLVVSFIYNRYNVLKVK